MLGLAAFLVVAVGCGEGTKKITVTGTVSYKGKPLSAGILKFSGPEGAYSAASIQPDGKYIMTDVMPGETKVGIMESPQGSGSSSGDKGSAGPKGPPVSLPEKYREPTTSGLSYTIKPDTKQLDIDIK